MRGAGGFNKEKGRKILDWVSFGFALVAGAAAAATFIGDLIAGAFGFGQLRSTVVSGGRHSEAKTSQLS